MTAAVPLEDYFYNAPYFRRNRNERGARRFMGNLARPDAFRESYILDEAQSEYREKPFQVKFADQDIFVRISGDLVEPVKKYDEAVFKDGELTVRQPSREIISCERLINGEPIDFYLATAQELVGKNDDKLLMFVRMSLFITEFNPNPYIWMNTIFVAARQLLNKYQAVLSVEQRIEFDAHHDDIIRRMKYTDDHPLPPLVLG